MRLYLIRRDKTYQQSKIFWSFFHVYLCIQHRDAAELQQITYENVIRDSTCTTIRRLKKVVGRDQFQADYQIFNTDCVNKLMKLKNIPSQHSNMVHLYELERKYAETHSPEQVNILMMRLWSNQKRWLMTLVDAL